MPEIEVDFKLQVSKEPPRKSAMDKDIPSVSNPNMTADASKLVENLLGNERDHIDAALNDLLDSIEDDIDDGTNSFVLILCFHHFKMCIVSAPFLYIRIECSIFPENMFFSN